MPKPESNALTLVAVLIAETMLGMPLFGLGGIVLLVILFAYDSQKDRTLWQSIGFAAVCGYCLMPICEFALGYAGLGVVNRWPPVIWITATILFLVIDRVRMDRAPEPVYQASAPPPSPPEPIAEVNPTPAPPPNAIALPIGAGKPATIYLNLIGEGLVCLRPVQAEHMGKDYYRIVESVPEGETWEYQPGQIVRCQKKNLSSGKALVAIDEAPRAK